MKKIYILLSRTGTVPSRIIHGIKGGRFTHTSISLTPTTDCLYSFARRKIRNPFIAGLIKENIHTEVFAQYPNCSCAMYSLEVSDEAYEKIKRQITFFFKNYKKAKYNFLGMIPLAMGIKIKRRFKLTCSQFVAVAIESSGEVKLPKDPFLMLPNDFMKIDGIKLEYEGVLKDCQIASNTKVSV